VVDWRKWNLTRVGAKDKGVKQGTKVVRVWRDKRTEIKNKGEIAQVKKRRQVGQQKRYKKTKIRRQKGHAACKNREEKQPKRGGKISHTEKERPKKKKN